MRIDRIYAEGEAINELRRLGFVIKDAPYREGLYEVTHPQLGGSRTFTVAQLTNFAEGAANVETLLRGAPTSA
ncbi:MAG TPA: hypothetical protein VE338_17825 [Ktedonobacterales bacterium]|jgi:hypothetical protein|nr:hypothetical protein [Ktedonobacterales bacterium]